MAGRWNETIRRLWQWARADAGNDRLADVTARLAAHRERVRLYPG